MNGEVRVVDSVPQAFAQLLALEAHRSIALSGGGTARRCYELLATADVDWRAIEVFFGDERWVPVHDPDSNEGLARLAFLDQVEPLAIHSMVGAPLTGEAGITDAADAYDRLLREAPPIDVMHLGCGPDGHTASLFPGSPALDERERLVVATGDELHPHPRLTVTLPAIARARLAVFTVEGSEKCDALTRIRQGEDLPASRVRAERVLWLVDHAAMGTA